MAGIVVPGGGPVCELRKWGDVCAGAAYEAEGDLGRC